MRDEGSGMRDAGCSAGPPVATVTADGAAQAGPQPFRSTHQTRAVRHSRVTIKAGGVPTSAGQHIPPPGTPNLSAPTELLGEGEVGADVGGSQLCPPRSPGRDTERSGRSSAGIRSLRGGAGAATPAFAKRLDMAGKGGAGAAGRGGRGCSSAGTVGVTVPRDPVSPQGCRGCGAGSPAGPWGHPGEMRWLRFQGTDSCDTQELPPLLRAPQTDRGRGWVLPGQVLQQIRGWRSSIRAAHRTALCCIVLPTAPHCSLHRTAHCIALLTALHCSLHRTAPHCSPHRTAHCIALHRAAHCTALPTTPCHLVWGHLGLRRAGQGWGSSRAPPAPLGSLPPGGGTGDRDGDGDHGRPQRCSINPAQPPPTEATSEPPTGCASRSPRGH